MPERITKKWLRTLDIDELLDVYENIEDTLYERYSKKSSRELG